MSEYDIEFFRMQGFVRRKCPLCNKFFWTLGEDKTCGEPPCVEYSFIGNSPMKKSMNLSEMREFYLSFFEKRGHTRIPRYPIIARWRDDIFFTIASVSCFQPWVLNKTIDPPANPLVMSQTCVRFNDIDNVGKTGRHLTEFEMMAHHAFNTENDFIYFKDRTVELCHNLLLKLGVIPEDITYIEAEWVGGGNSGPCFEVIVGGVELATLVFMMYEDSAKGKVEMSMQVVDTGYGLERFTWLSQGSPNVYEAIFGDVLTKLKSEASIHPDERILGEYAKLAGMMNVESNADLRVLRRQLADRMNASVDDIIREVTPFEHLYSVCDHTRSLMFMLNDGGIVPSNVKAGYFARLLARKSLRSIKALGLDIPLSRILSMQIDYLGCDFPELAENKEDLLDLVEVEEKKYDKTMIRGKSIVCRIDEETKSRKENRIGVEKLIYLYDSHGLTPEVVAQSSELEVIIPDDFYIQVAARHDKTEIEEENACGMDSGMDSGMDVPKAISDVSSDVISDVISDVSSDVEPTYLGFYDDAYVSEFKAKVLKRVGDCVILDKTFFYPEGGGQETDYGCIDSLDVVEVVKVGNVVVHRVKGDLGSIREGDEVECRVDWDRRLQLMQHHTGTHIINGAARQVLGNHAWQAGAHKSEKLGRIDLTHHSGITEGEIERIEELANKVIAEKRPVIISFMERDDAENRFGFRIYQGGVVPCKILRIVDIEDWDVEACGGMHFRDTSEVGCIKVTDTKRIQDGVVRIEFKAGKALDSYDIKRRDLAGKIGVDLSDKELQDISCVFSVQVEKLPKTIERFRSEWMQQRDELKRLKETVCKLSGELEQVDDKYKTLPSGESVEAYRCLFEEWKTQKKEAGILRDMIQGMLSDRIKNRFVSDYIKKEGVKIVKEIVYGLDVKNLLELAKSSVGDDSLLIIVNKIDKKVNILIYSKSLFKADDVAKRICKRLGGGARGTSEIAIGGGSSEGIEKIVEEFEP